MAVTFTSQMEMLLLMILCMNVTVGMTYVTNQLLGVCLNQYRKQTNELRKYFVCYETIVFVLLARKIS